MLFIEYPKCSTCQKAKCWLDENGIAYTDRHILEQPPTYEELKEWYARSGLPLRRFFNTSGLKYKSLALKDKLPTMTEDDSCTCLPQMACLSSGLWWSGMILSLSDSSLTSGPAP